MINRIGIFSTLLKKKCSSILLLLLAFQHPDVSSDMHSRRTYRTSNIIKNRSQTHAVEGGELQCFCLINWSNHSKQNRNTSASIKNSLTYIQARSNLTGSKHGKVGDVSRALTDAHHQRGQISSAMKKLAVLSDPSHQPVIQNEGVNNFSKQVFAVVVSVSLALGCLVAVSVLFCFRRSLRGSIDAVAVSRSPLRRAASFDLSFHPVASESVRSSSRAKVIAAHFVLVSSVAGTLVVYEYRKNANINPITAEALTRVMVVVLVLFLRSLVYVTGHWVRFIFPRAVSSRTEGV